MLASVVKGKKLAIEKLDRNELAALLVVRDWMDGILDELPDAAKIRARLAREDFVAPLRHLAKNFIGREAELDELEEICGRHLARERLAPGKEGHIRPCRQPRGGLHHR